MVLSDGVLDRLQKYKDDYKLSNILYGMKAIEKMAHVFYPEDKTSRNKWIKKMKHKSDNCVYFVYNHKRKGKSHRFLAPNSDLGESFYSKSNTIRKRSRSKKTKITKTKRCKECRCKPCLCDKEIHCYKITCSQKKDKKKKTKKKKRKNKQTQKGGFCPPCFVAPVATALGFGGLGTAAVMVSKSSSTKSANGKTIHTRKESYKMKKNDKWIKKVYEQKNNKIYLNNKEIKPRQDSIQKANKRLNKRIRECIKSGFKQC